MNSCPFPVVVVWVHGLSSPVSSLEDNVVLRVRSHPRDSIRLGSIPVPPGIKRHNHNKRHDQSNVEMIRFFLLQNRHGKTRLAKYYTAVADDEKRRLEHEVSRLVLNRDPKYTNFVEVRMETKSKEVQREEIG